MATDTSTPDELRQRFHRITPWDEGESIGDKVIKEGVRQLNLPGQYLRGLLAGKPGTKMSQEELYQSGHPDKDRSFQERVIPGWGGPRIGDAIATDPLTYAGPGLLKAGGKAADLLRAGGRALGAGPAANPLANAVRKFAGEESGKLDWDVFGKALPSLKAQEAFHQLGPDEFFRKGVGYGIEQTPAHQLDVLGERVGVPVHWGSQDVYRGVFGDLRDPAQYDLAAYYPRAPGIYNKSVVIPTTKQIWWDPYMLRDSMLSQGSARAGEAGMVPPWLSTTDPQHLAVHELSHALHHRAVGDFPFQRLRHQPFDPAIVAPLQAKISRYSATNPQEAVAETASKGILNPQGITRSIPYPIRKQYTREWEGPDIRRMKKELGL